MHLWDSYNVLIPILSKTYASGGTSAPLAGGCGHRIQWCCLRLARNRLSQSHIRAQPGANSMMDILMLAIAAGLFAAGIGYAYVCERL
jgi:hypothetical protein